MQRSDVNVGAIHMVMSGNVLQRLLEKKQRYPYLPEPAAMLADLHEMNRGEGVPAIISTNREGKEQLLLYAASYYLALYESSHRDGYTIGYVDSMNLHEHARLSKGAIHIRAQGWYLYQDVRQIPPGNKNFWTIIYQSWCQLERQKQQAAPQALQEELTHTHERYLDTVEDLIEATHDLEQARNNLNAGIFYQKVESAGEERDAPRDIYIFRLNDIPQLTEKSMLRLKEAPDLRGRVVELEGTKLTLKFEALIDRKRIPERGHLEPTISPVIYRKQREALTMLRMREAKNIHLLRILVNHHYLPYQPDRILQSSDEDLKLLTHEQFEAFRRALTVPDILMVLGPPGTGKTRTITEIARHCGFRRQRVLITSGTHKAVDNVLERMPPDLIVIRVGHESNVSEKIRPKMIDAQAEKLQEVLLENTENQALRLTRLLTYKQAIQAWEQQLSEGLATVANTEAHLQAISQQRFAAYQRIIAPFTSTLNELEGATQKLLASISRAQKKIHTLKEKQIRAEVKIDFTLFGWIFRMLLHLYTARIEKKQQMIQETQPEVQRLHQERADVERAVQQALLADGEYQQQERYLQYLTAEYEKSWEDLLKVAHRLQATMTDLVPGQPEIKPKIATSLQQYSLWYRKTRGELERKAKLLEDWREELRKPTDQLYPELLRYADVVGATCIGTATAKGLEDIEFDLAIVDEAGQIGLPDLLVPLVRAKRAVLVGDHHQLPPFVDNEVQTWLRNRSSTEAPEDLDVDMDTTQIANLLTKSAFEQLFTAKEDPAHIVRFTIQGRMPQVIADFASRHFYHSQLGTFSAEKMLHTIDRDPLFRYPFAVIDTTDAPAHMRYEQQQRRLESLGESGYTNVAEALLIASIAEIYQRAGKQWIVIVPYRAQARKIIQELRKRIDTHDFSLEEHVSTVDSFQGGERNKVIYGFTRSNEQGRIGFLKELRRLNVAMTRAQQQLVLVGYFSTLTRSDDARFNQLMIHLRAYVEQYGELLSYAACSGKLRSIQEGKGAQ